MWGVLTLLSVITLISANTEPPSTAFLPHPLDPLSEAEIATTVDIIRRFHESKSASIKFNTITLKEPDKSLLLPFFLNDTFPPPGVIPRKAFAIVINLTTRKPFEVTVNLELKSVEKWVAAPDGANPFLTDDEATEAQRIMTEDPGVIKRCKELGWDNMSLVESDPWTIGYIGDRPEYQGRRLVQIVLHGRNFPGDNQYAHPFDFRPIVDLDQGRVITVEELPTHTGFDAINKEGNNVPRATSNYHAELLEPQSLRQDLKPLHIVQPEGASYTVLGNEIRWQKFKFRIGFNGREGAVIHHVSYKDESEVRPLFYKMSLTEMFVPYGDPRPPFQRLSAFDIGEYGAGFNMFSLEAQKDCLGAVHFFDGTLHNDQGEPFTTPQLICVTEEDDGILWKHVDYTNNQRSMVRARRLAVLSVLSEGNYDYIIKWIFYQDGTIEFNVRLSGLMMTSMMALNANSAGYGTTVFSQVNALYHQHFFTLRVDPEIDGNNNSVVMHDVMALEAPTGSPQNPYGQGLTTKTTVFHTASEARTHTSPKRSRTWDMINPKKLNPYSKLPVAYRLVPWNGPSLFMQEDSPIRALARWLNYDTWVTEFKDDQKYPGGDYISLTNGTANGLANWVDANPTANIEDVDVVLWHSFGLAHIPRTEDFPIMPFESCSIKLRPVNFFSKNPAVDVPPPTGTRER